MEIAAQYPNYQVVYKMPKKITPKQLADMLFIEERTMCFVTGYYLKPYTKNEFKLIDCTMGGDDAHKSFLETSIPTSVYLDTSNDLCDKTKTLPNAYPTEEQVKTAMQNLGMKTSDTIVLYGQPHRDSSMTRAYHILTAYGFNDVTILDGGLLDYTMKGYPTCPGIDFSGEKSEISELADPTPYLIQMDEIVQFAKGEKPNMQLLDARGEESFNGHDPNLPEGCRQGHVPGAINIPADSLINAEDDCFLKYPELVKIFQAKGVDQNKDIVVMCKTGVSATIINMALTFVGYSGIRLYDGSWTEYGSHDTPSVQIPQRMPLYMQPSAMPFFVQSNQMPAPQYIVIPSGEQYMAIRDDKGHLPVYQH
jgi:thiosulfate/3-mercaptopyruvate sulfurtransferase